MESTKSIDKKEASGCIIDKDQDDTEFFYNKEFVDKCK